MTLESEMSNSRAHLDATTLPMLRHPTPADGAEIWRLATESGTLDVNSPYAYLMWSDDFSATSVVAESDGVAVGFITGYRRPTRQSTLMVWQVAVAHSHRGRGLASAMLNWLVDAVAGPGERLVVEATVSPADAASRKLFHGFARGRKAALREESKFGSHLFPGVHDPEPLLRIGPLSPRR
jgi:L-2,4-diaminobutyric acid acetyltransferase